MAELKNNQICVRHRKPAVAGDDLKGTLESQSIGKNQTLVTWTSEFNVEADNAPMIRSKMVQMYRAGLQGLNEFTAKQ